MKQDWTVRIFKQDARYARGERLVSTTQWRNRDEATILRECQEIRMENPTSKGYRVIHYPAQKTVTNLMTGKPILIDTDTPRCCDPSSELYWSM